jgi:hypothetical protein
VNDQSPIDPKVSIAAHTADARTVEEGLAIQERQAVLDSESATAVAMQDTLLTPRFYTTDFDELDAIDVTPVREDWDADRRDGGRPEQGPFQARTRIGTMSTGPGWTPS